MTQISLPGARSGKLGGASCGSINETFVHDEGLRAKHQVGAQTRFALREDVVVRYRSIEFANWLDT